MSNSKAKLTKLAVKSSRETEVVAPIELLKMGLATVKITPAEVEGTFQDLNPEKVSHRKMQVGAIFLC